jgi:hypothetical protein
MLIPNSPKHDTAPAPSQRADVSLAGVLRVVAFVAAATGAVFLFYAASVHADPPSSDGATIVLEGQSMAAGHLALHGWSLSLDSFWTLDALLYAVAVRIAGVRWMLLDLVPAILALAVVVAGAVLARDGRKGLAGWIGAGTVVALIALPSHVLSIYLLKAGLHVATALLCLLAFAALRTLRFDLRWAWAVVAMAAGILGDVQMISLAVVPVMVAGLVAAARHRHWRSGAPALVAGPAAIALAGVVRLLAQLVGTFALARPQPRASWSQVPANIAHIATLGAQIFGVGSSAYGAGGVPVALEAVRVVGLAAVVAAVVLATWSLISGAVRGRLADGAIESGFLDDVLVIAFFGDCATFVVLASTSTLAFGRYLTAGAIFGTVLAGRLVARLTARLEAVHGARAYRVAIPAAGLAVAAAYGAGLGYNLAQPAPVNGASALGQFLAARHLHNGVGDYWSAAITTVITDGNVVIRPVIQRPSDGDLVRYGRNSTQSWYAGQHFQFLVFNGALPWGGVDAASASRTFGPAAHTYRVGTYYVLTYARPFTVSAAGS